MGNTPSSRKISAQDRAILDMKNQRDKLHQYQKRITVITDKETEIARECLVRGDKPKALLALRRKKFQDSLLAKTDAQLETLEQLTSNIEFALVQNDVLFGLRQGTTVLKQIHKEMGGIEHVDKLMGENEEARAYQHEISEMLRGQMSNQDEDEVEEELEALQGEVESTVPSEPITYPTAPAPEPYRPEADSIQTDKRKEKARTEERSLHQAAEPMLA